MTEIFSIKPLAAILVSAIASLAILMTRRSPNLRETWTLVAAFVKFALVLSLFPLVKQGHVIVFPFFEIFPGQMVSLRVDTLGLYFALLSSFLWIITSIYSIGYMRSLKEHAQTRYYFSFALSLSAALGIAFSGDLITFFIFYEMLTLATYPLVVHKETREAIQAGRKYLVYALSAGVGLLFAIVWTYQLTGNLTFTGGGFLPAAASAGVLIPLFFLFIFGCSVKSALFPLHAWLPSAMVAPTPVSALLHAVAVVKAGVFGILRVTGYVFGPDLMGLLGVDQPLAWLAAFTLIGASCLALVQDNLKRRLAYSTIGQLSYIVLGAVILERTAYFGAVLHLMNHALMKITLFFCAGVIYARTHLSNISQMRGIGRQMPWTMGAFAIGAIGIAGLPPMNGFVTKWILCQGAIEAGATAFLYVYLISALLNLAYFAPVLLTAYMPPAKTQVIQEKPWTLVSPPVVTAALVVLFGTIPAFLQFQASLAEMASSAVYGG